MIDGFDPSDRQKTHQILAAIGVKKQTLVWRDGLSLDTSTKKEKLLASCLLANSWVILHSSTFSDDILIFLQTCRTLNLPFTEVGSQDMKVGSGIFLHLELEMNPLPYHSARSALEKNGYELCWPANEVHIREELYSRAKLNQGSNLKQSFAMIFCNKSIKLAAEPWKPAEHLASQDSLGQRRKHLEPVNKSARNQKISQIGPVLAVFSCETRPFSLVSLHFLRICCRQTKFKRISSDGRHFPHYESNMRGWTIGNSQTSRSNC